MIELNLLPKELRKKKRPSIDLSEIPVIPVAAGVVGFLVVFHFLLILVVAVKGGTLRSLQSTWKDMQPQKKITEQIASETGILEKRIAAVRRIAKPELSWTQLLSGINQAMIPGIWLSDLEVKFKGQSYNLKQENNTPTEILLTGYSLGKSETATSNVAKFINSLKRNKEFSDYFSDIELENMKSKDFKSQEAMVFKLTCTFKSKPQPTPAPVKDKKKNK